MYKSVPLVITYIITYAFCIISIVYEVQMVMCDKTACYYPDKVIHGLMDIPAEDENAKQSIAIIWKIRDQLSLALGLTQLVIILALYLRMKNLVSYLELRSPNAEKQMRLEKKMRVTEKTIKKVYIAVYSAYLVIGCILAT